MKKHIVSALSLALCLGLTVGSTVTVFAEDTKTIDSLKIAFSPYADSDTITTATEPLEDLLKEKHIELSHDVALIHSHNSNIESPKIVLVLSKNRVSVGEYSKDYKLIILLLSPKEMELKEHLGILAEIAKFTKNNRKLELLYGAKNYADFINKINNEKI